jgi:broad specificity phosphatase PhoE
MLSLMSTEPLHVTADGCCPSAINLPKLARFAESSKFSNFRHHTLIPFLCTIPSRTRPGQSVTVDHGFALSMELYLIRHGETVDNVAGVYAGVRDSALTNHGVEQAQRLGRFFQQQDVRFSHIFSSTLSRARRTAEAIASHQKWSSQPSSLQVQQVPDLIEQNFGYYEGKTFQARANDRGPGRDAWQERTQADSDSVDVESKESMMKRADAFLDEHLLPLFLEDHKSTRAPLRVAVISHGILLGNLWRRLLARLSAKSVTISPDIVSARGTIVLEHLGGWSNTGYLSLSFAEQVPPSTTPVEADITTLGTAGREASNESSDVVSPTSPSSTTITYASTVRSPRKAQAMLSGWSARINAIDSKQHLSGLKRQRGGIGSLAHDSGQQRLESFFKRQKKEVIPTSPKSASQKTALPKLHLDQQ